MFRTNIITGCLILTSLFISCDSTSESTEEAVPAKKVEVEEIIWESEDVNESSELALLMRKMWEQNMELKKIVANGGKIDSFPKSYYTIHTANATNPDEINDMYHSFANMYLNSMDELTDPLKEGNVTAFNNMVKTCIACHNQYCQGPIPKIKKLYIKPE